MPRTLSLPFKKELYTKRHKTQFELTEQASETDPEMAGMLLELSDQECKINIINVQRALMENIDNKNRGAMSVERQKFHEGTKKKC